MIHDNDSQNEIHINIDGLSYNDISNNNEN